MLPEESLTEAERRLVKALPTGELVDLRECPPPERTIRAELLAEVLTGRRSPDGAKVRGARLAGAAVSGELDLEAATLSCPMLLWECSFDSLINLREARAMTVRMPGCSLAGIQADLLEVRGSLDLRRVVTVDAEIRLVAAHVSGQLHLDGAALASPGGYALAADGLTIDQSVFCRQGFTATGEVCFVGSRVGGSVELDGAHLVNPNGPALNATGLTTAGDLSARDLVTEGTVRLAGAHIAGTLSLSGAQLSAPGEAVLLADGIRVDQDLFLRRGFTANGEVRLIGGHVTGTVDLGSACLVNRGGTALNAVSLAVEQEVFCGRGFQTEGEVVFSRARMSTLSFDGAHLSASGGCALLARGLTVEQDLLGENGFSVEGELKLSGARIGGRLDFTGAKLENPSGVALDLQGVHALELSLCLASAPQGLVDLTAAQVDAFHDDPVSWPSSLRLRDFSYERLANDGVRLRDRLDWLKRHQGYTPGVYDRLAVAYRRAGHVELARRVGMAKQRQRRRQLGLLGKAWSLLLGATVGHGYRPWLAGVWLMGLLALGGLVFGAAYPGELTPAAPAVPEFNALAYTIDVLVPVVDLGQRKAWLAHGPAQLWAWALTGAGWILTTAVVAGLTNALKRE